MLSLKSPQAPESKCCHRPCESSPETCAPSDGCLVLGNLLKAVVDTWYYGQLHIRIASFYEIVSQRYGILHWHIEVAFSMYDK